MPRRRAPTVSTAPPKDESPVVVDEWRENRPYADELAEPLETRGEKKRRAEQLERLGESLVNLPPVKLARVALPDDLAAAVAEAQRIKKTSARGGYRRQIQFIGRIMRTVDARPIAAALDKLLTEDAPSSTSFQLAERWRDRLIAEGDAALTQLAAEVPGIDLTTVRQLARQAQKEGAGGKPPHASRALFRVLREFLTGSAPL